MPILRLLLLHALLLICYSGPAIASSKNAATLTAGKSVSKYWVFFRDKPQPASGFSPEDFFDPKALERRRQAGLPLFDETDLPVNQQYVRKIKQLADSMGQVSRWFNAVGAWASPENAERIRRLPFVRDVVPMTMLALSAESKKRDPVKDTSLQKLRRLQIDRLEGYRFREAGLTGKGIRIAVLDIGFKNVDTHPAFRHLMEKKQILKTWDFVKNKEDVYHFGSHGTMVLSCIAGRLDTGWMGMAQDAEFLLARTERLITEVHEEEDNWVAAAEWADKNGAQIITTSLGYSSRNYFRRDMDGRKSIVARGAAMAVRKGILVLASAGNEGNISWKIISTPADADSVLAIGGTVPYSDVHIEFSSFGPNAREVPKPNVSAPGYAAVATPSDYSKVFGTSFSCPLMAGFAACLWQHYTRETNMQIFRRIEKSASLYPYFDYAHGYGIPKAGKALESKDAKPRPVAFAVDSAFDFTVRIDTTVIPLGKSPADSLRGKYLYYHVADSNGFLIEYYVIQPETAEAYTIKRMDLPRAAHTLRIHFEGYTREYQLNLENATDEE